MTGRRLLPILSGLWLALLVVYLVWGGIAQAGLYYWAGTFEIDLLGAYDPMLPGIVPGILLGLPALVILGREARRERLAPPDPAAGTRAARLVAIWLFGLGGAALVAAIICFLAALGQRDGAEPAVPFVAATLGSGPPPAFKVRLTGTTDPTARTFVSSGGRFSTSTTTYSGFHEAGDPAKGAPFRVFIERWGPGYSRQVFAYAGRDLTGYLIENGLPPLVRYMLEHQGVAIASPHYMLLTTSGGLREPYYVGAGVGTLLGWMLIAIGGLLLILPQLRAQMGRGNRFQS